MTHVSEYSIVPHFHSKIKRYINALNGIHSNKQHQVLSSQKDLDIEEIRGLEKVVPGKLILSKPKTLLSPHHQLMPWYSPKPGLHLSKAAMCDSYGTPLVLHHIIDKHNASRHAC